MVDSTPTHRHRLPGGYACSCIAILAASSLCGAFSTEPLVHLSRYTTRRAHADTKVQSTMHTIRMHNNILNLHHSQLHQSNGADNDNENSESSASNKKKEEDNSYSWAELQADPELSRQEFESSMKRRNSMLLPQRISQAVSAFAWLFVIVGIILNQLGYAYIRDPTGGIGVGTLDERDFQRELYSSEWAVENGIRGERLSTSSDSMMVVDESKVLN